ncbi:CoA pyrophosphatase [Pseudonocardia kujensis]|uniref:NUDIX hydrolase n=1 Tax=Pseudonocardia kujensis TaxID=1128675 RepID=UPI001E569671|nr:CoA pyrophosphatase [Pseudonocardia kujensis]MCE0765918.1 CoA pyrophosphatase [Pseudonocardia kujensis]
MATGEGGVGADSGDRVAALRAAVEQRLAGFERRAVERPDLKRSAVTLTLVTTGGDGLAGGLAFLLTRRAATLRRHSGQWALPGGRCDPGETITETGRRELLEEVGLALGEEAVLGLLDDYPTRSGYVITPVVLWGGAVGELTPNPDEVGELYRIPLADIDVEPRFLTIPESEAPVIQVPLFDRFVHAPTGAVLYQARELLLHGRPTRVDHLEQPVFAWR